MSAMTADAMVIAGEAARPAKKRHTSRDPRLGENPQPSVKMSSSGRETRYTGRRPRVSLAGEPTKDPKDNPKLRITIVSKTGPNPGESETLLEKRKGQYRCD